MTAPKDLLVLVADYNAEAAVNALLARWHAIGICELSADVFVHLHRDPGVWAESEKYLRPLQADYSFALVVMDREGSGEDTLSSEEMELRLEARLEAAGWTGRCSAVVIDPELDRWVWSVSPNVEKVIRWNDESGMREWLRNRGFNFDEHGKPLRPKEALEAVLFHAKRVRNSNLYRDIAMKVSLLRCDDRAFVKLRTTLQDWFGAR